MWNGGQLLPHYRWTNASVDASSRSTVDIIISCPVLSPAWIRIWSGIGLTSMQISSLLRTALNKTLPGDLVARMEERIVIDQLDGAREHVIYPDVRFYQDPDHPYDAGNPGSSTGVAEPIVLELDLWTECLVCPAPSDTPASSKVRPLAEELQRPGHCPQSRGKKSRHVSPFNHLTSLARNWS